MITDIPATLAHAPVDPFIFGLTVFVLACFVGYYVVWRVTPALHTPLMAVTNAVSGIIIVGAIIAAGSTGEKGEVMTGNVIVQHTGPAYGLFGIYFGGNDISVVLGLVAITLASINIFGGFIVTQRMLAMFRKKEVKKS